MKARSHEIVTKDNAREAMQAALLALEDSSQWASITEDQRSKAETALVDDWWRRFHELAASERGQFVAELRESIRKGSGRLA